ncbi:hypothetical protein EBZ38_06790 [bacterium]|nr:hypothetical protein [bacterium]
MNNYPLQPLSLKPQILERKYGVQIKASQVFVDNSQFKNASELGNGLFQEQLQIRPSYYYKLPKSHNLIN